MRQKYFGENVKFLRTKEGISQRKLAETIGLTNTSISTYEKGGAPSFEAIEKIADYFSIPTHSILYDKIDDTYWEERKKGQARLEAMLKESEKKNKAALSRLESEQTVNMIIRSTLLVSMIKLMVNIYKLEEIEKIYFLVFEEEAPFDLTSEDLSPIPDLGTAILSEIHGVDNIEIEFSLMKKIDQAVHLTQSLISKTWKNLRVEYKQKFKT